MKRFISFAIVIIGLLLPTGICAAVNHQPQIVCLDKKPPKDDPPPKGHRIPSAPTYITVDFEYCTVLCSISSEFISYEVWDEDGCECEASFSDETSFVSFLDNLEGVKQLRLYSSDYVYIGYIAL